jgi:hypothetical protein
MSNENNSYAMNNVLAQLCRQVLFSQNGKIKSLYVFLDSEKS